MLVDTHTHVWKENCDRYPWRENVLPENWSGAYPVETLREDMAQVGVDKSVLVTTPLYGRDITANDYVRSILEDSELFWGVGLVDTTKSGVDLSESAYDLTSDDRMIGIRLTHRELRAEFETLVNTVVTPLVDVLEETNSGLFLFPHTDQLKKTNALLETIDHDVPVIIDHAGMPSPHPSSAWKAMENLAAHSNVWVKLSAIPRASESDWPYEDVHGIVRKLVTWYGVDRLMLGSDYPWMHERAAYGECLSWIEAVAFLSSKDTERLRGGTFADVPVQ